MCSAAVFSEYRPVHPSFVEKLLLFFVTPAHATERIGNTIRIFELKRLFGRSYLTDQWDYVLKCRYCDGLGCYDCVPSPSYGDFHERIAN